MVTYLVFMLTNLINVGIRAGLGELQSRGVVAHAGGASLAPLVGGSRCCMFAHAEHAEHAACCTVMLSMLSMPPRWAHG